MLRVIAYACTYKDVTVIGQEHLFFNLNENWEFGGWVLILLRRRFCNLCKAKPMKEITLGYLVLTFACLA